MAPARRKVCWRKASVAVEGNRACIACEPVPLGLGAAQVRPRRVERREQPHDGSRTSAPSSVPIIDARRAGMPRRGLGSQTSCPRAIIIDASGESALRVVGRVGEHADGRASMQHVFPARGCAGDARRTSHPRTPRGHWAPRCGRKHNTGVRPSQAGGDGLRVREGVLGSRRLAGQRVRRCYISTRAARAGMRPGSSSSS